MLKFEPVIKEVNASVIMHQRYFRDMGEDRDTPVKGSCSVYPSHASTDHASL